MLFVIVFMVCFVPMLRFGKRAGHMDYGIYAYLQVPFIAVVLLSVCWRLRKARARAKAYLVELPMAYILCTASSNLLGERFLQVDHSKDLPIRKRLVAYSPPNQPPTKAEILTELGPPLASAIISKANKNLPEQVRLDVGYGPEGTEVLVYEETARNGRHFTYFIFIDP